MEVIKCRLSELRKAEKNIRMHPEVQLREYRRSLEKFGQIKPLTIDENNVILTGNGMYTAMISLGWTEAYCHRVVGLSEADKKKLMMADNRIFSLGVDDLSVFDEFLSDLSDDLNIPGYSEELLNSLLADCGETTETLSEYGKIDEEAAENIRSAASIYENPSPVSPPSPPSSSADPISPPSDPTVDDGGGSRKETQSEQPFVVCPNCGEKIWL